MVDQILLFMLAILVLGVLIFVHELGHFLLAKFNRIAVLEFALGFGPALVKRRIGETLYAVRMIPLGGYVRMAGDDPFEVYGEPSPKKDGEAVEEEAKAKPIVIDEVEQRLRADRSRWFLERRFLPKASVVLAGPGFNLLFAILIAIGTVAVYGKPTWENMPVIGEVFPDYPAAKAGLQAKDRVTAINGKSITTWEELSRTVRESGGVELRLNVDRPLPDGTLKQVDIVVQGTADTAEMALLDGGEPKPKEVKIGIVPDVSREPATLSEAFSMGTGHVFYLCRLTFRLLGALVKGVVAPSKVVGGPIAVFSGAAKSAKQGIESLLDFMVLLSVSLAIFNLFPIPILDGGHLMFFVIEAVKGGKVSLKVQTVANQIGIALLLMLMVFALSNDIRRLL